jgi:ferredoxin-type protein NapH
MMQRPETRKLRAYTVSAVIVLALSGAFIHSSWGTLSSFGYEDFSAICPLGSLEAALASRTFVPRLFVGLGVTVLATLLLGRVFCAWGCPIPYVRRWFAAKNAKSPSPTTAAHSTSPVVPIHAAQSLRQAEPAGSEDKLTPETRYLVLGGALLSSAIFGFPVFCLICPVGLFFGTLFALMRLLRFNEPTIMLLVFPAVLILEVVFLRKWCNKICPIGALIGLVSGLNRTIRPRIDTSACLATSRGMHCLACKRVCPEAIDLHETHSGLANGLCTKCGDCVDVCPAKAIRFIWWEKKNADANRQTEKLARKAG